MAVAAAGTLWSLRRNLRKARAQLAFEIRLEARPLGERVPMQLLVEIRGEEKRTAIERPKSQDRMAARGRVLLDDNRLGEAPRREIEPVEKRLKFACDDLLKVRPVRSPN